MSSTMQNGLSVITVLLQGFLSFFSPCVLPLLPLYIGYLSGGAAAKADRDGGVYSRQKVLLNTLCFVIGIGFSFFLLGFGMRAVGRFFGGNQLLFARAGGIIVILFGLYQLGLFGSSSFLMNEKRIPLRIDKMAMSPLTALLLGFVFSFAWTPCVGPTLSSVLLLAASEQDGRTGFLLVGVYTLGFALPFLLAGIFTNTVLGLLKRFRGVVRYTAKVSGVLLLAMGLLMLTGRMNSMTARLSRISGTVENAAESSSGTTENAAESSASDEANTAAATAAADSTSEKAEEPAKAADSSAASDSSSGEVKEVFPAPDFTLTDQYGDTHTLSDYRGKVVFLNFWATWCPPCRAEMPDIQALYDETAEDEASDLVILGVVFPDFGDETSVNGIRNFLDENLYTYPILMDEGATLLLPYYITAYPTTYLIDRDGNIFGYVPGSMTREVMDDVIAQAMAR